MGTPGLLEGSRGTRLVRPAIAWYPIQPKHTFTAIRVSCFQRKGLVGGFRSSSSVMPKAKAGVQDGF
jgi:hypothetical protein